MSSISYRLYHHPLDASSRRVRLALAEKAVACDFVIEKPWEPSADFLALNPSGEVPVLVIEQGGDKHMLADAQAICEYLDETQAAATLLGKDPYARAEVRRLVGWFDGKFAREVTMPLLGEKALKRLAGAGEPDSQMIHTGMHNIRGHLDYISWLTERRNWLAGDSLTFADLAAGAQLSVIDYLGDVPWSQHIMAKEWYARLKSRPSFRTLLGDHVAGFPPPRHYADLDF
ncbi:MAG TPA: glutathione S-transferase family protein [Alphaproteobacteria bacterium]|nr:glutathione S-transferase family protein [Alphaproteobacteria bacterium]